MTSDQIVILLTGALAGGFVSGLTGFGTGITAIGIWVYAISPSVAASLVIICSIISQAQTFPMIWRAIKIKRVLLFIVPGLLGVPIGTQLLAHVGPNTFKVGVGFFLVIYSSYMFINKSHQKSAWGGRVADSAIGFGGGVLGGLAGLSGPLPVVWTAVRGWKKDERRSVIQTFNLSILLAALLAHALSGLLTNEVGRATVAALPGTLVGALVGARVYKRLGDRDFQRVVLSLLFLLGGVLLWTTL